MADGGHEESLRALWCSSNTLLGVAYAAIRKAWMTQSFFLSEAILMDAGLYY
jgi:hypothetical protein